MTNNFSHGVAAVGHDSLAKLLSAVTDGNDALGVAIPRNVQQGTRDDRILASSSFDRLGLPYSQDTSRVTTGNLESAGRKPSNGGGVGVAGVFLAV